MKKVLLTVVVALVATLSASAQYNTSVPEVFAKNPEKVVPGLKYSKIKKMYNKNDYAYLADPEYGTGRAWLNLLVPGLAQYTMGESGRGTRYLIIGLIGEGIMSIGTHDILCYSSDKSSEAFMDEDNAIIPIGIGSFIMITNYICSIVNANKMAKVKSLYDYDLKKLGRQVSVQAMPYIAPARFGSSVQTSAGVTLAVNF